MKLISVGDAHRVLLSESLIVLIVTAAAVAQRNNAPPKSWDDYEVDLFADAAKKRQGMTGFTDRYRPSWWPSRGRSIGGDSRLYRSNYGPQGRFPLFMNAFQGPFLGRKRRPNYYDSGRNANGKWNPAFRPRPIRQISPWNY